jgi:hypothetical protein
MSDSRVTSGDLPSDHSVPKVVVSRLSLYLRELQRLQGAGQQTLGTSPRSLPQSSIGLLLVMIVLRV